MKGLFVLKAWFINTILCIIVILCVYYFFKTELYPRSLVRLRNLEFSTLVFFSTFLYSLPTLMVSYVSSLLIEEGKSYLLKVNIAYIFALVSTYLLLITSNPTFGFYSTIGFILYLFPGLLIQFLLFQKKNKALYSNDDLPLDDLKIWNPD